jgi:hypothetical protein
LDLASEYSKLNVNEATELQIEILRNAEHVWAAQGGNAILAMTAARSVTILMRGGQDYPEYMFLKNEYDCNAEVIYEVCQSKHFIKAV